MTDNTLTTIDVVRRTVTLTVDDNVYEWRGFGGRVYRDYTGTYCIQARDGTVAVDQLTSHRTLCNYAALMGGSVWRVSGIADPGDARVSGIANPRR